MASLMEEATKTGMLLATGALAPGAEGITVRLSEGTFTVTDDPCAGTKELIGRLALLQVSSTKEVIAWTKRFPAVVEGGESRIRRLVGPEDFEPRPG